MKKSPHAFGAILAFAGVALALAVSYAGAYLYFQSQIRIQVLSVKNISLKEDIAYVQRENTDLQTVLANEQSKNTAFANQIGALSGTVGTLTKLSTTDPELLKKYSKVYFLNENYLPKSLSPIDPQFLYDTKKSEQFLTQAIPYLQSMLAAANQANTKLQVVSAYRSFGEQFYLKTDYRATFGIGANKFSADQGYSEHQLGTASDFTMQDEPGGPFVNFDKTAAYAWLTDNAYRFGFILSYPKDNGYYVYEPWHWRFVGVGLATALHAQNKHFYDLTQQEIDQYLISLFD